MIAESKVSPWVLQLDGDVIITNLTGKRTWNPGGAKEQMVRSGGAQRKLTGNPSTARDICTEAETVQESL